SLPVESWFEPEAVHRPEVAACTRISPDPRAKEFRANRFARACTSSDLDERLDLHAPLFLARSPQRTDHLVRAARSRVRTDWRCLPVEEVVEVVSQVAGRTDPQEGADAEGTSSLPVAAAPPRNSSGASRPLSRADRRPWLSSFRLAQSSRPSRSVTAENRDSEPCPSTARCARRDEA